MITTNRKAFIREFNLKYKNPSMRLHLEEQGWKYIGEKDGKILFKIFY